jgi:hypothetical protein
MASIFFLENLCYAENFQNRTIIFASFLYTLNFSRSKSFYCVCVCMTGWGCFKKSLIKLRREFVQNRLVLFR